MTKDAQVGRAFIESALTTHQVALDAGVNNPHQLARILQLGAAVASFVGHQAPPRIATGDHFAKIIDGDTHIMTADTVNGLVWDVADFGGKEFTFEKAQKACAELRTGGHSDWRLPTIQELLTLVDYTRSEPAIDKEFFPNCRNSWYRTSTPYAPDSGYAWFVSFDGGHSYGVRHGFDLFVRAVRASQS